MVVPSSRSIGQVARALLVASVLPLTTATAYAASSSSSYPEPVVHWVVQKGESCAGISDSLYGSPQHTALLHRYNSVDCAAAQLPEGTTLVVPASITSLPDARLKSMSPAVRARSSGGGWSPVQAGAPLFKGHNVNTLETGRADIEFVDRTRVFLAENTLVVLYGTAANTAVKKNVRQTVELEQGEVKAGLAALRGDAARVGVQGGGDVQAASRETVVQRKGDRTTVAVFDGTAAVRNGGAKVDVPTNHGTRFVGALPPVPPRPLPPAPIWEPGGVPSLVIAPPEGATLSAGWQAVDKARAYRFEIARDEAFRDLIAREEIPSNVRSFRAEKIPAGTWHVSVRAIDQEDYLGIAATRRSVQVVTAVVREGLGSIKPDGLEVTPYTVLSLASESTALRIGLDGAEPGPAPAAIDFGKVHPTSIRVQSAGAEVTIPVTWRKVTATIEGTIERSSGRARLRATIKGLEGIDLDKSVHPVWRVHLPSGSQRIAASVAPDGSLTGSLTGAPGLGFLIAELVDGSGNLLGRSEIDAPPAALPPPAAPIPTVGIVAPPLPISTSTDVLLYSPTAPTAFAVTTSADRVGGEYGIQGMARAMAGLGRFGLEASMATRSTADGAIADESAWFGARIRTYRADKGAFEHAFALRASLPASYSAPGARLEPSSAIGGVHGRATWLLNAGARIRLSDSAERTATPSAQGFLLAAATWSIHPVARLYAMVDTHLLPKVDEGLRARGGASFGIEAGTLVFGGFGMRVSPFDDVGGPVTLQLALGFRER